jgi:hypothetical protein
VLIPEPNDYRTHRASTGRDRWAFHGFVTMARRQVSWFAFCVDRDEGLKMADVQGFTRTGWSRRATAPIGKTQLAAVYFRMYSLIRDPERRRLIAWVGWVLHDPEVCVWAAVSRTTQWG